MKTPKLNLDDSMDLDDRIILTMIQVVIFKELALYAKDTRILLTILINLH